MCPFAKSPRIATFDSVDVQGAPSRSCVYLVERYWPGVDEAELSEALVRLESVVRASREQGGTLEHAGSILLTEDEVVLSVFTADNEKTVIGLNERAGLPLDRIAEVTLHGFTAPAR